MNKPIVLLTDFGYQDSFVGIMKGMIAKINPSAHVIDLNHEIPPQNIRRAAFELLVSFPYFPASTLFVCVVDPGVGSQRQILFTKTKNYYFLAPDNGLLSWVLQREKPQKLISVEKDKYFLKPVSHTFHGRDIFAPVAAYWSKGTLIESFGQEVKSYKKIAFPEPDVSKKQVVGEVLVIDKFGNLFTNLPNTLAQHSKNLSLTIKGKKIKRISNSYSGVKEGQLLFVKGSHGFIEIALRNGSAHKALKVKEGESVHLILQ